MNRFKKLVLVLSLISVLTASPSFARHRDSEVVVYVGSPLGLSTVLCMVGDPLGCAMLSTFAAVVTTLIALDSDVFDKQQMVFLAQDDAGKFLLGGEMTPVLEETMQMVLETAKESGNTELAQLSKAELAAQIFTYKGIAVE